MFTRNSSPGNLCALVIASIVFLGCPKLYAVDAEADQAKTYIPRLERILNENIVPFWLSKSLDLEHGGYTINFGPKGELKENTTKMIVTQARTMWLFSRLARAGYDEKKHLKAAELGYHFLKEKMWDEKNGGFYWEVDVTGDKKLNAKKHLYGQAFALYGVSEYYLASKKRDALKFANRIFDVLEAKCHDKEYAGYIESFNEDWTAPPADELCCMGVPSGLKLMNTHLHLLEAMTTFYRASKLPLARERLIELINIQSNAVMRKGVGACTDKYDRNWQPRLEQGWARVSYGHDIENIWLLIDACNAAGVSNQPFVDLYRALFEYSLKYGYDESRGGFYDSGEFAAPADKRDKVWWVQAEAIVSSLYMHRLTGDAKYVSVFEKTLGFIEKNLVDWENGEWHSAVSDQAQPSGDKANAWKAGYHNGRAMMECLDLLKQASASAK